MKKKIIIYLLLLVFAIPAGVLGEDTFHGSLNQRINFIFGKGMLLKESPGSIRIYKSGTPTILEAKAHPEDLSSSNRFVLFRPTDTFDEDYYGKDITVLTYDTEHFRIHYTEDNTYGDAVSGSDGDPSTVPEFVRNTGNAFENSYSHILSLGYNPLPGDGVKGGDSRYDVYIVNLPGCYGYTSYDDIPDDAYTVIDNDFTDVPGNLDPDGKQAGAIKVTAAHELFHAFQMQYTTDTEKNGWWMEATAVWMEDEVYPNVNDYLNYIGLRYYDVNDNGKWDTGETYYNIDGSIAGTTDRAEKWFDEPDMPLDTYNGEHEYGTVIWAKYLSENYGKDIIRHIWEKINESEDAIGATRVALIDSGTTLNLALIDFREKLLTGDFEDGSYYPKVRCEDSYESYPQTVAGICNHLSSLYYAFKEDTEENVIFTFSDMNTGNLFAELMERCNGIYNGLDVKLDDPEVKVVVSGLGTSISKVVTIVMNNSMVDDQHFSFKAETSKPGSLSKSADASTIYYLSHDDHHSTCFISTAGL